MKIQYKKRKREKRYLALLPMTTMLVMMVGCNGIAAGEESAPANSETVILETQVSGDREQESVVEAESEGIQYGDKIQVSLNVHEMYAATEELGEWETVVENTSKEFCGPWADFSAEAAANNVEAAIGKHVGDTFTLWFESGDTMFAYEYTILEIIDKPAETVNYGDRIQASCVKRISGDESLSVAESKEETELTVSVSDYQFNAFVTGCDWQTAQENVAQVIGKGIGDTFDIEYESMDGYVICEYTILGIEKCVEYGDNIRVSCRQSSFAVDGVQRTDAYDSVELPVWSGTPDISMEGYELSAELTRTLFQELMGKDVGDTVTVCEENMDILTRYTLTVLDVDKQPEGEADLSGKEYFLAENEDMELYNNFVEGCYWVLVDDSSQKIMHVYYCDTDSITYEGGYSY